MMKGIQVLNETVKWTSGIENLILGILIGLATLFLLWLVFEDFRGDYNNNNNNIRAMLFFFTILFGLLSFGGFYSYFSRTSYTQYQVIISNTVKMNEFNEKYRIISQDSNIYTITEKDKE